VSIDLPQELVWVINMIGLPWPEIEEDQLHAYASHLREYATSLSDSHNAAHAQIQALSSSYSSPSYDVLAERWQHFASTHVTELIEGCHSFATALDVAGDAVHGAKIGILTALGAMATEVLADQGAAIVTLGASEALIPGIVEGTRLIIKAALDQLEQQLIAEGLQAVLGPLEDKLGNAVQNMVLRGVEDALA
jgi:hypothetical protein